MKANLENIKKLTMLLLACAVLLTAAGPLQAKNKPGKPAIARPGDPAPDFTLTDQAGKQVKLSDYKGMIVVLEWLNFDCPFSKRQHVNGVTKSLTVKYAPECVVWLGINSTHYATSKKNAAWAKANKLTYPILNDQSGRVGRLYGARTTPDMRIIDAKGKLIYSGAIDDDPRGKNKSPLNYIAKALDEHLAGPSRADGKIAKPLTKPYGCSVKYAPPAPKAPGAPGFSLADHNGKIVNLSDFAGKVVVLEWINLQCPFSKRHYTNGAMKKLAAGYLCNDVVWLAINSSHFATPKQNKAWVEKYSLPYPILDDSDGKVGRAYGAKTTPDMRIIGRSGKVIYSGGIDNDPRGDKAARVGYVDKALAELAAGKKVSTPKTKPYGCSVKYRKGR